MPIFSTRNRPVWTAAVTFCLAVGIALPSADGGEPIEKFVTLRDGTILRIDLASAPPFSWNQAEPALAPSDLAEAAFSEKPAGDAIREIRRRVAELNAPSFEQRQKSSVRLLELAPGFTSLLTELKDAESDPESRLRIAAILAKLPPASGGGNGFDLLVTKDGKRLTGDVADWSAEILYRGFPLRLSRKNVAQLSASPPDLVAPSRGQAPGKFEFAALRDDVDAALPANLFRTGFEADPAGVPLKIGDDISARFTAAGFQITTSIEGAIVSVNDFAVQGRSKGLSAATHSPLWEGTLKIRFHLPGRPGVPASVTAAGFWIASVSPDGTALEAYDTAQNLVGTVKTKRSGNEFLAFRSPVPIAEIRIVPNDAIDSNYTIDDLFFTTPVPLGINPETGWGVFQTRSGERLLAREFEPAHDAFTLQSLSFGAKSIRLGEDSIAAFAPPPAEFSPEMNPDPDDIHWLLLKDGSRLRATRAGYLEHRWATFPEIKFPGSAIAALWGKGQSPQPPPDSHHAFLRDSLGAVTRSPSAPNDWLRLKNATLGETWLDSPDRLAKRPTYADSPVVWFALPPEIPDPSGRLFLTSGDQIQFSAKAKNEDGISIQRLDKLSITLRISGNEATIPMSQIATLQFPSITAEASPK